MIASPPIETAVDWPRPAAVSVEDISVVMPPEREITQESARSIIRNITAGTAMACNDEGALSASNSPPGTCSTCHNGTTSTGKPTNHFGTQLECDTCHSRTGWTPLTFRHSSANYPGDHATRLTCTDCHASNVQAVPWQFPAYAPDCAACHASDYKPGPHRNASVSQLRDCAGSCHQASPEHSVRSREW